MQSIDDFSANETRRVVRLGFIGIFLLVLIYAITSIYHVRESTRHLTEIVEINNILVTELNTMRDVIRQRQILLNQMLASKDPFEVEELSLVFFDLAKPFRMAREKVQQLPITSNEEKILNRLINQIRIAQPINQQAARAMTANQNSAASADLVAHAQVLQSQLMKTMEQLIEERKAQETAFVREGKSSYETVFIGSVISAFFIILLIIMIARIITAYVSKKNNELLQKNAKLEEVSKLALEATHTKSAFLATMSHEIRTPLTAIIGFAEINLEHKVSEENRIKHTRSIVRNGKHLLQIINDILDISKVEANRVVFEKQPYSLFQALNEVKQIISPQIKEKNLELIIDYEYPLPEKIVGDSLRLKQVVLNICINAIKFTETGRINLKVACDFDRQKLFVEVIDTGIGMSEEQVKTIFDVFTQADSSITRKYGGTGLGLALAKQFAEGMGGTIKVHSMPDIGSRFSISIDTGDIAEYRRIEAPLQMAKENTVDVSEETLIKKVSGKILLAEDNIDNQQLFRILLEKTGANIVIVNNGLQAVEKAMTDNFDLIFMDMQMPVMDGLEATKTLRTKGCDTPIVSLTANAMKQDREACFKAGCNEYIAKPINKLNFYYTVYKYLKVNEDRNNYLTSASLERDPDVINLKHKFIEGLPDKLNEITLSFNKNNFSQTIQELHKLKGLGGSFDCPQITVVSQSMELALKNNDVSAAKKQLNLLSLTIAEILQKHKKYNAY